MSGKPPCLIGVLETVLYFADHERTATFYRDVLGLRKVGGEPGRSLFFRAGGSVFLMFQGERALEGGKLPAHGARGPIHTCFLVPPEDYPRWKTHLEDHGVRVLQEVAWNPGRSFYFHDPDGNLIELADRDIWPP